jgi:VWFA-related protein
MVGGGFDRAREAVETFVEERFREGDLAGVVAGDKMVGGRLTSVREEILSYVRQVKPRGESRVRMIEMTRELPRFLEEEEVLRVARNEAEPVQRAANRACNDDNTICEWAVEAVRSKALRLASSIQKETQETLTTVNGLASGLARVPGPKTIVFLSNGFAAFGLETSLRHVVGQTARAGARVYAIDVRGLNRSGGAIIDSPTFADTAGGSAGFDALADGVNSLAVDTGGLMIRNENNIGRALGEIADDAGTYYVLGYQPTDTNFDGKYRKIEIRVKGDDVRVRARQGYLALDPSQMTVPR